MKKGYEIQKISVINHLDRYLQEAGANEDLLSLIIESMTNWDDNMQIECALSFIKPIQMNLVDKKNKQKILKITVEIISNDSNASNEKYYDAWLQLFDKIVGSTDLEFILKYIFPIIMDLPSLKNPYIKRKRGNRLMTSFAKQLGEIGFEREPNDQELVHCERFQTIYLPELIELLNDEEAYIRIEVLEILTELMQHLDPMFIEKEFLQVFIDMIEVGIEDILLRLANILGKIIHGLQIFGMHKIHIQQILDFYVIICKDKSLEMRRHGAYNLACFNLLFKDEQEKYNIDFCDLYLQFAKEQDPQIRYIIATSIHEAYILSDIDQDTSKLREAYRLLLEDSDKEILSALTNKMDVVLKKYYFTSVYSTKNSKEEKKGGGSKKILLSVFEPPKEEENINQNPLLPEYINELIFSDLLAKILIFDQNLSNNPGLWRSTVKYLRHLSQTLHQFNAIEFHEAFIPSLLDYIRGGNSQIRQAASDCLSKILKHQYSTQKRQELINLIRQDLAESQSCILRKTYIYFCKSAVQDFSREFFKNNFQDSYLNLSKDRVATVRMEFAHSIVAIKPYLDYDVNINLELMDILNRLKMDSDRDVVEAVEQCDFKLLQQRKRSREEEKSLNQQNLEKIDYEAKLVLREQREEEERKKRMEEEEESKFDFQTLLQESSKKFKKGKYNPIIGRKSGFGALTSKNSASSSTSQLKTQKTIGNTQSTDKTPTKKKAVAGSKNPSLLMPPQGSLSGTNSERKSMMQVGSSIGVNSNGDFQKRNSVLVTSSSSQMAAINGLATQNGIAKASTTKIQGRKGSTLASE
eukprot:403346032